MANFEELTLKIGKSDRHFFSVQDKCLFNVNRIKKKKLKNGQVKIVIYLRCYEKTCKCSAKINDGVFIRINPEINHNHRDHSARREYEKKLLEIKATILIDHRPVREIHREILQSLSRVAAGLFEWKRNRVTLQRIRQSIMPPCPDLATFIKLLEENDNVYRSYGMIRNEQFYQGSISDKSICFANLEIVAELETDFDLYVDATFSVTPFRTHQLLVVLATILGRPRPIFYAIMTSRSEKQYVSVFEHLRDAILGFDGKLRVPKNGMSDFEKAMRRALIKVWPNINMDGCNFHFTQALHRKATTMENLSTKISGNSTHHKVLLMFMRLSLLPIDRLERGYNALKEYIASQNDLSQDYCEFIAYFERTWLKRFPPQEWCVSHARFRTNNHTEGYNRYIKQCIQRNPSPWQFLDGLIDLAFEASSSVQADKIRRTPLKIKDRSKLSQPLKKALSELEQGKTDEFGFINVLARVKH